MAKRKSKKELDPPSRSPGGAEGAQDPFPTVVGIGASAGGLAALKAFFAQIPPDSGLVYVVVVHLSPDYPSHLSEILQPHIRMPVQQVEETVLLEPNHVFVIPPNANLNAIDTHLRLTDLEARRHLRAPVDHFFRTLARTHDGHAVGVILSGTGSDGALGVKEIKEKGGLTIVQDPAEAEYDGMPQSAVATGVVDLVLPLAQIPDAVIQYAKTRPRLRAPADEEPIPADPERLLHKVFAHLRARTDRDFTRYKRSTILRRIVRRMQIRHVEELGDYIELLRSDSDEVSLLADDLLITVTSFFRDPRVFEVLESEVIPKIFEGKGPKDEIRVWTVGCATGEEAYSIAMLLLEQAARCVVSPRLQVFASDLHDGSLEKAREGFFPGDIESDVSAPRLRRFFHKEDGGYRIHKQVRELVVFAPHNVLRDPPFSRLDLVSCRNLMIYLERDAQRDVAELFHYALRPNGYLVLGASEVVEGSDLFVAVDKGAVIYQRREAGAAESRLPVFAGVTPRGLDRHEAHDRPDERLSYGVLHARVAERYGPPSMLVGPDDRVVHLSENAGRYLVHPGGELTANVFQLIREELRIELRAALFEARKGRVVTSRRMPVHFDGETAEVILSVRPSRDPESSQFVLVIFDERDAGEAAVATSTDPAAARAGRERELEVELDLLRQRLRSIVEEYESTQEEMKAANEELQSSNEELRSTMEELETSKEELHSMNEELQTMNQENRLKMEELGQLSNDLQSFLGATHIATVFLDRELRILRYTNELSKLFAIRPTDRGRPLSDLAHRLHYDELAADISEVMERLNAVEREVRDEDGRWYLTRAQPYRSSQDRLDGVVLSFVDITARKQMEETVRQSEGRLALEVEGMARLYELIFRLVVTADLRSALDEVLEASLEISGSPMGDVQLWDPETGSLHLVAHRGFSPRFIDRLRQMESDDFSACSRAVSSGQRVLIEDVRQDPLFAPHLEQAEEAGFRAVQSTPLLSRNRELLGVLSTHYRGPGRPSDRELRLLDVYAQLAAEFIEAVRSREALREASARKDEFLGMLGHELRNPLGALRSAVELLRASEPKSQGDSRLITVIERQERQLSRLVDDLLDVGRITQGKIRLRNEVVDLAKVIDEAAEMQRRQIDGLKQNLVKTLPEGGVFVEGDPMRLVQVVSNLLHNASKFAPAKSRIDIRLATIDHRATIDIQDRGIGLAASDRGAIFDLFYQVDRSLTRAEGGLGIGLTVVKKLVEMHGGEITAASEGLDRGTTFRVALPVSSKRQPEPRAQERGLVAGAAPPGASS